MTDCTCGCALADLPLGAESPPIRPGDRIRFSLEMLASLRSGGDRSVVLEVDRILVDEAGVKTVGLRRVDELR